MRRISPSSNGLHKENINNGRITEVDMGSPELFMSSLWIDDDIRRSVLEDIQQSFALDDNVTPNDATQRNGCTSWNHVYNTDENDHYHNGISSWKARERRRMKKDAENRYRTINASANTDHGDDNDFYPNFYGPSSINENVTINHQMNCFTIINKHYALNSETSSDDNYADIEIIDYNNEQSAYEWNGNTCHNENIEELNREPDLDTEKRTVWIYSYKNRHDLLYEPVVENINIPSMSTSSTDADEEDKEAARRVSSPIPSSLIPRLNLTRPTLPTVTEVTEVSQGSSSRDMFTKKHTNSWIAGHMEVKSVNTEPKSVEDKSTNFDSVTLSARERRRLKIEHTNIVTKLDSETQTVNTEITDNVRNITQRSVSSQTNMNIELLKKERTQLDHVDTICENVVVENTPTSPVLVSTEDIATDICSTPIRVHKMPRIQKKPIASFPGSVEALHGSDWIRGSYAKVYGGRGPVEASRNDAGHRLLVRNALLLRSAPWADYGPVADSVPSLQISVGGTEFDGEKIAWWRRALRCLLCR